MSDLPIKKNVRLTNEQGLHMRPADAFVRAASQFESEIQVAKGKQLVDGKSILSILTLAADEGAELTVIANGSDAEQAVETLVELVASGFAEDDVQDGTQMAG